MLQMQIKSAEIEKHKLKLISEKNEHLEQADNAYTSKRDDQLYAKQNLTMKTLTFDLQQCLPTPFFRTSVSFYKRQLWTFNLTIHDAEENSAYNMMWHEAELLLNVPPEITHLVLYSDSCAGQNKNFSHRNVPNFDSNFTPIGGNRSQISRPRPYAYGARGNRKEKKKKTTASIHHPRDWYNFIRSANSKYFVSEITRDKIYNFSALIKEKFLWRKTNTEGEQFVWQKVKWLRYTRKLGHIEYKTNLCRETEFQLLNIPRRGNNNISRNDLELCYPAPEKISTKKKSDLLDMLPLISKEFHKFYYDLETDALPDTNPDLIEGSDLED